MSEALQPPSRARRVWTKRETDLLKRYSACDLTVEEVARLLGRPVNTVYQKSYELDLPLQKKMGRNQREALAALTNEWQTVAEIAAKINRDGRMFFHETVGSALKALAARNICMKRTAPVKHGKESRLAFRTSN